MEGSGQWPQDKGAIKRIKAAFHLQLAELLQQQHQLVCRPAVTHTDVYKVGGGWGPSPDMTCYQGGMWGAVAVVPLEKTKIWMVSLGKVMVRLC